MNKKTTTAAGAKRVSETQGKKFLQEAFYHEQLALLQKLVLAEKSITHQGNRTTFHHDVTVLPSQAIRG